LLIRKINLKNKEEVVREVVEEREVEEAREVEEEREAEEELGYQIMETDLRHERPLAGEVKRREEGEVKLREEEEEA
jgi:hypothetical protein